MKKRSSNMELLRIVAMIMIIAFHMFCHCINVQLTDLQSIAEFENAWYCHPLFFKRLCVLAVISPMGNVGNAIFIIISGYFMAQEKSIDLIKISKKLLLQLGFAAMILGLVSIYAYHNVNGFPIKLIQFSSFNEMSWYVGYYFIVIVIAKVFLNKFLTQMKQKNYIMFIMTLFALVQFSWSTNVISNLGGGLEVVCTGVFLYTWGGYVKKYNPFENIRLWVIMAIIVMINIIVIGNFYLNTADNILAYRSNDGTMFIQSIPIYGNNQAVPIILGIAVFELFRRIRVPNNRVINFIGASTFMVYLLHDNEFVYKIWNTQDWITLLYENVIQFFCTYIVWIVKIFAVGILAYCVFVVGENSLNICKPLIVKQSTHVFKENL